MTAHSSHLRHLIIIMTLPGCLWVTDAELEARLGGKSAATNGTTTSVIDTADTDTDANDGDTGSDPEAVDNDNDGSPEDQDCDDNDAARTPGADEICDGVDNNCDDVIDNDATDASPWYRDGDGDGFADAASEVFACEAPEGFETATEFDCDDSDATISPAALERLGDDIDENCDGEFGPVAAVIESLPTTGLAPVVLTTADRSSSESMVLAWASARCGPEESEHLCGGTFAWTPDEGATWTDATADEWERTELSPDRLLSFSYDELHVPVWAWIGESASQRFAFIQERETAGDFDPNFEETVSWIKSEDILPRVAMQSYDTDSGQMYAALVCDPSVGLYYYRREMRADSGDGEGFATTYRVAPCELGHDLYGQLMVPIEDEVYKTSWDGRYRSAMNVGYKTTDLMSTPAIAGIGFHAVLGTESLLIERCQTVGSTSRCEERQQITVSGGLQGDLAHEPTTGHTWACVVEEDGEASLIYVAEFGMSEAETWQVSGVTDASTCAITATSSGHVTAAIQTSTSEVHLVEARSPPPE